MRPAPGPAESRQSFLRARWVGAVLRFGGVGALCAAINVGIVYLGTSVLGWHYLAAAFTTCVVTIPLGYVLHGRISFRTGRAAAWSEFLRFLALQMGQFFLGLVLLALLVELLGLPPTAAMVVASALLFAAGFVASSTWVYRAFGFRGTPGAHDDAAG